MANNSAPLHGFHLIASPGVKQAFFGDGAERAVSDVLALQSFTEKLFHSGNANVQPVFAGFAIGQQGTACRQSVAADPSIVTSSLKALAHGVDDTLPYLIVASTYGWAQCHKELVA